MKTQLVKGKWMLYITYRGIALEIINSDHWDKAMRMCNGNDVTPMRLLIKFMPGIIMHYTHEHLQ